MSWEKAEIDEWGWSCDVAEEHNVMLPKCILKLKVVNQWYIIDPKA